jgi:hypothetical protein
MRFGRFSSGFVNIRGDIGSVGAAQNFAALFPRALPPG